MKHKTASKTSILPIQNSIYSQSIKKFQEKSLFDKNSDLRQQNLHRQMRLTLIMSGVICRLVSLSAAASAVSRDKAGLGVWPSPSSPSFLPRPGLDVEGVFPRT